MFPAQAASLGNQEASPSLVYGARLLSGFGVHPPSCVRIALPPLCAASSTDRAPDYGSGGWGFESLAARTKAQVNGLGCLFCLPPDHPLIILGPAADAIKEPPGDQEARRPHGGSWSTPAVTRSPAVRRVARKTGTGRAAKAEAAPARSPPHHQVGAGQHRRRRDGKTVADLLEAWFSGARRSRPSRPEQPVNYRRYADQKLLPALGRLPSAGSDTATMDRFYAELRQRGSKCQHCYRRMRDGQPPMRPGEVFRLASPARSASTRPTACRASP